MRQTCDNTTAKRVLTGSNTWTRWRLQPVTNVSKSQEPSPAEVVVNALLISGSQVRALLGSPLFSMICDRLQSLSLFICDQLTMSYLEILKQNVTGVVIPLDSSPRTWTSMEEVNRRLCQRLTSLGITPVLIYAGALPPEIDQRMRDAGAQIEVVSYGQERYRFSKELGRTSKIIPVQWLTSVFSTISVSFPGLLASTVCDTSSTKS